MYISVFLILTACPITLAADFSTEFRKYQPQTQLIGYPPFNIDSSLVAQVNTNQELFHSFRMTHFLIRDVTAEKAEMLARKWDQQGFNIIIAEGTRYLFRDEPNEIIPAVSDSPPYEEIIQMSRLLADACHKYGLKFFLHQTCTMVTKQFLSRHPAWASVDIVTGKSVTNAYGMENVCLNNDEFMSFYVSRLDRLITESKADGLMQDEVQFFGPSLCGCKSCRIKFAEETGLQIPEKVDGWLYQFTQNPSYTRWLDWRREKVVSRLQQVRAVLKLHGKEKVMISYLCNNSASWSYFAAGHVINDFSRYADVIGYECEPPGHFYQYYWPLMIAELKYLRAVAEQMNTDMWTLFYNSRNRENYTWNWLVSMTQASRNWWVAHDDQNIASWQPLLNWERKYGDLLAPLTSAANIGVFFSLDSRDRNPERTSPNWIQGFMSTCYALTDGHIPYKVITDQSLAAQLDSGKIKTLILFDTLSMSDTAAAQIRKFVSNGGIIVASGSMSLYTENGQFRGDFALADVLGVHFSRYRQGPAVLVLNENPITGDIRGKIPHCERFIEISKPAAGVQTFGQFVDVNGIHYPAMALNTFAKGRAIYFAGYPERHYVFNYYNEPDIKRGEYWVDNRIQAYGSMICRAAVFENTLPLMVTNIPKGVVVELYEHQGNRLQGIQVHLANFIGGYAQEGVIPANSMISFPDVRAHSPNPNEPFLFKIHTSNINAVFLFSPDYDETVSLDFMEKDGFVYVSLPKIDRYAILYLSRNELKEIIKLNETIVKHIPPAKQLVINAHQPLVGECDANSTTVFWDSSQIKGGYKHDEYNQEGGIFLYGRQSGHDSFTADIIVNDTRKTSILELGGIDDNSPAKTSLLIQINDKTVLKGKSGCNDDQWSVWKIPLDSNILCKGKNTLKISNIEEGPLGNCPWFGINFIRIK